MLLEKEQIKLVIRDKLIICALGNLHYQISREKVEPEPGFETRTCMRTRIARVVEHRARNPEVQGRNSGSGSNFSLEI